MASFNARAAATVHAHFGSLARAPPRASSVKALSTRRVAAGDPVTRWAHSDRSCSATLILSTTSTATAPLPAALRSSYATRRQVCEHQIAGQPRPFCGTGDLQRGHRLTDPSVAMPKATTFVRTEHLEHLVQEVCRLLFLIFEHEGTGVLGWARVRRRVLLVGAQARGGWGTGQWVLSSLSASWISETAAAARHRWSSGDSS